MRKKCVQNYGSATKPTEAKHPVFQLENNGRTCKRYDGKKTERPGKSPQQEAQKKNNVETNVKRKPKKMSEDVKKLLLNFVFA